MPNPDQARVNNSQAFHIFPGLQDLTGETAAALSGEFGEIVYDEDATPGKGLPIPTSTQHTQYVPFVGRSSMRWSIYGDADGETIDYAIHIYGRVRKNRGESGVTTGWWRQRIVTGIATIGTQAANLAEAAYPGTTTDLFYADTITLAADEYLAEYMVNRYSTAYDVYDQTIAGVSANEKAFGWISDIGDDEGVIFELWDTNGTDANVGVEVDFGH